MKTTPDLLFKQAYDLHYKCSDAEAALNVYQKIISEYPSSPEAGYAQTQIQNIEKNRELLDKKHTQNKKNPTSQITITTAPSIDGFRVIRTLEVITAECVFGMNIFRDFFAAVTDIFGGRSSATQRVLRDARRTCLAELKKEADELGANAVIAVKLDYSEFSGGGKSMLFLVASGTAVVIEPALTVVPQSVG